MLVLFEYCVDLFVYCCLFCLLIWCLFVFTVDVFYFDLMCAVGCGYAVSVRWLWWLAVFGFCYGYLITCVLLLGCGCFVLCYGFACVFNSVVVIYFIYACVIYVCWRFYGGCFVILFGVLRFGCVVVCLAFVGLLVVCCFMY